MDFYTQINDQSTWILIANPKAGSGRCRKKIGNFESALRQAQIPFKVIYTTHSGHAETLAKEWAESGYNKFMVAGGDGTLHEVLNGLMACALTDQPAFTIASVPLGTANDWARYYQIHVPEDLIQAIIKGNFVWQDLGKIVLDNQEIKNRWFINVMGLGFDSYVAAALLRSGKSTFGKASYLWMLLKCLFSYKSPTLLLSGANIHDQNPFFTVNLGITRFSGNGMQIVPHADPQDGLLALTRIAPLKPLEVIMQLRRLFDGSLGKHHKVKLDQIESIHISHVGKTPVEIEADGEIVGATPATFYCIPKKILVPSCQNVGLNKNV